MQKLIETVASDLFDLARRLYRGMNGTFFAAMTQAMLDTPVTEKTLHLFLCPEHKCMEVREEIRGLLSLLNYKSTSSPMWPGEQAFVTVLDGDVPLQTGDVSLRLGIF